MKEQYGPKVETAEVSGKNFAVRLVFAIVFLISGSVAIAFGFKNLAGSSSGWQEIEVGSNDSINCSNEITLNYNLGTTDTAVNVENKEITSLYTNACIDAYEYFTSDKGGVSYANLYDLNAAPNETLTVSDALYDALSTLEEYDSRAIYLGPIYSAMNNIFTSETDVEARAYDPYYDEEQKAYFEEIASYASDENAVSLKLLSDNQVKLSVSQEYLDFADENGITKFVDLSYLQNAFATDYIADTFIDAGYTNGILTSYDGYTRYLDDSLYSYGYTIYGRDGVSYYEVAEGTVSGLSASVVFTDFSTSDLGDYNYRMYEDGTVRGRFVSLADGLDHEAMPYLLCASENLNCAQIALSAAPYYISDSWDAASSSALEQIGIFTVYCENDKVISNMPE